MDIYRDFAYAQVLDPISASTPGAQEFVKVDSHAHLPSSAEMASGEFWMTLESTLPTGQFEIVQATMLLTAFPAGGGTEYLIRIKRGQDGTQAYAHPAGTYLKGSITAAMLRRAISASQYKRYADLGNPAPVTGVAQCFSNPKILRGVSAGQAGGATVVAGALVLRGLQTESDGIATSQATLSSIASDTYLDSYTDYY